MAHLHPRTATHTHVISHRNCSYTSLFSHFTYTLSLAPPYTPVTVSIPYTIYPIHPTPHTALSPHSTLPHLHSPHSNAPPLTPPHHPTHSPHSTLPTHPLSSHSTLHHLPYPHPLNPTPPTPSPPIPPDTTYPTLAHSTLHPPFRIWCYILYVEHISCVITNCGQNQWVIHSLFSIALEALLQENITRKLLSLSLDLLFKILLFKATFLVLFSI